ncbi:GAF domain-containing protein [Streptomyces misionensis]|uniref:GAF domain-containing protein n=1 Tax=Streptomyces misionensis TaxID=67331 RepID=UPI0034121CF7
MKYDPKAGLYTPAADPELDRRQRLLEELGLDRPDALFDQFAADLAHAAGTPYAMVNAITTDQSFVGLYSQPDGSVPQVGRTMDRNHGYCPDVLDRRRPLVLPDVFAYPRFAGNEVVDMIGIRTYAGAPLIHEPTNTVLGTVCVVGLAPRPQATGKASLELIKKHRDALMDIIYRRSGQPPQQ